MDRAEKRQLEDLLETAAVFRALARGFSYPDAGHKAAMRREFSNIKKSTIGLREIERVSRAFRNADEVSMAAEYSRLFLGNGPVSLHETAYGDGRRIAGRTHELADISGFYRAFGVEPSATNPDLPDHICTELEYYSLLLVKQAYAESRNQLVNRKVTEKAAKTFLEQHLGRWIGALVNNFREHSAASPYLELANALQAVVTAECKRLRVRPQLREGRLPFDEMQAEEFVCPHAPVAV